ncbi:Protein grpE [Enterobacter sp. FY-07]|nr:Protein grpE [Enterobacter sp. FY-07]
MAVATDFQVAAPMRETQANGAAAVDNQRACRQRMREHRYQCDGVQRRRQNRPTCRKRIGGGASWRRDNQSVGTLRKRKNFVNIDFEFDHMGHFARVQHHFINGGADAFLALLLADLHFQQKAFFSDIMPFQHIGKLLLGVIRVEVGEKTEIAAVNADNIDIITGQGARRAKHITVATDHHRQIAILTNFRQRAGSHIFELQFLGNLLFNNDIVAFCAEPAIKHFMCGQCGRVPWVPDNTNTLEMVSHVLRSLWRMNDDNLSRSLESRKLIPIISQVSEMNAKKRGEIHE